MKIIEVCASRIGNWWLNEYYGNNDYIVVFPLYLYLDIGKLDDSRESFLRNYIQEDYIDIKNQIESFLKLIDQDVLVRIWSSKKNANDYLLVYYMCNLLRNMKIPISVIYTTDYNEYVLHIAQMKKEEFLCFFDYQKRLSKEEVNKFAMKWDKLVEENGELRVCVGGTIVSKNYRDYDEIILSMLHKIQLEDGICTKSKLVGRFMAQEIISDMSVRMGYFLINRLIQNGKIKVVKRDAKEFHDVISLTNE